MTFWAVGASLAGAVIGGKLASKGAKDAARIQSDSAAQATALQREQYNQTVQRNAPFYQGGLQGLQGVLDGIGSGKFGQAPTQDQVMAEPGYQFGLDQGMSALNRYHNARGLNGSGAQLKAAARYGTDYATTKYGDAFNRFQQGNQQAYNQLSGVAGLGQQAANNTSAYGNQFGAQAGQNAIGAGNAGAANALAQGNIFGNVINQGISAYRNLPRSQPTPYYSRPGTDIEGGM